MTSGFQVEDDLGEVDRQARVEGPELDHPRSCDEQVKARLTHASALACIHLRVRFL